MADAGPVPARIRLWGVRGTCPAPGAHTVQYGGNTPCVELRSPEGELLVLDAGTGIRGLGQAVEGDGDLRPVHLFLSHRHGDHLMGLPHFGPAIAQNRDVFVACGDVPPAELQTLIGALLSPPLFPPLPGSTGRLVCREWDLVEGRPFTAALRVRGLSARHPGGATVIVVEGDDGLLLAYAPDNELSFGSTDSVVIAWREALAQALRDVPVLIHDATYTDAELAAHVGWGHSSAEEATKFAVACNAATLLLFHHHPDRRDSELTQIVTDCRELARSMGSPLRVDAAAEGVSLDIRRREAALV